MFCCKPSLEPSIKLTKFLNLLKIIGFIHYVLVILDIFIFETNYFILLFFQLAIIHISICKKDYGWFLIVMIIYLFYIYEFIESVVRYFILGINDNNMTLPFCFNVFIIIFEIFGLFLTFQTYKQAKHEMRIKLGFIPNPNEIQQNRRDEEDIVRLYNEDDEEENSDINDDEDNNIINDDGYNDINKEENNENKEENKDNNNKEGNNDNMNEGNNGNNNQGEFQLFKGHSVIVGGGGGDNKQ